MVTFTRARSWVLLVTALFIIVAWPPDRDRSLMVKAANWAADPAGSLPVLPEQLGFGLSDDVLAVEERDAEVRRYDDVYNRGALARARLRLKVAEDPLNASTERQFLLIFGALVAFLVLRR
jgi:hypothetical protein